MKFNLINEKLSVLLVALGGSCVMAAAPVATFIDSEPGIQYLFSGDPDTTESTDGVLDCARDAPRATTGGESGKMHNDFLLCDNWDFQPKDWGKASFLQGSFVLGDSPFSNDGGWSCEGNQGPGGNNPCVNSTVRAQVTAKHGSENIGMDTSKDWVFSFDFTMSIAAGDTFGNDTLLGTSKVNDSGDLLSIHGAGANRSFFVNGEPGHYYIESGSGDEAASYRNIPIPVQMNEGKVTVHYKADNHKMDLWFNDELVVADFESKSGDEPEDYAIARIQTGGGGISFENSIYDNIFIGVLGDGGAACGPQGPGASAPGDFNCDGVVDVADLGIVGANFNNNDVTYIEGDANMDNVVDVADLGVVGANWSAAQSGALSHALQSSGLVGRVPEPATFALLAVGLGFLAGRRR